MNKEEILAKSRAENVIGDERDKTIEQKANENAYLAIMIVFLALGILATIQEYATGSSFANYRIFTLSFFIGWLGKNITKYIYLKEKQFLIISIFIALVSIGNIIAIVWLG